MTKLIFEQKKIKEQKREINILKKRNGINLYNIKRDLHQDNNCKKCAANFFSEGMERLAIPIMLGYTLYEFYENLKYITQEKHHACI